MRIRELMTTEVVTVSERTPLKEAAQLMSDRAISGLPVLRDGTVVGVVSEADFVARATGGRSLVDLLFHRQKIDRPADTVGEIMATDVVTIGPDASHVDAARLMDRRRVKRLPVVDAEGRLLGVVSRADILTVFTRSDAEIEEEIRHHILAQVLAIEPDSIEVLVDHGHVTLAGTVPAKTEAALAEELASRVDGVIAVESTLHYRVDDTRGAEGARSLGAPRPNW
ncbi:MAG TPA: CBS domain-containing protein [Acidimicrobiia bacterium]|nr:CBS domain-containing protein [Acidimicrobiia bacterium]